MDAETVADLLTRERRSERPALVDGTGREFDYHWLCTSSWQAGNFLRHTGIRRGVTVGIVGDGPFALLAFFGTALLEGTARFDPPRELANREDFRTLVAPTSALDAYDIPPGAQRVGYGGRPDDPAVRHFEAGLWRENPSFPATATDPDTPLLEAGSGGDGGEGGTYSHGTVLRAARIVADEFDVDGRTRVGVRGPLSDPRVVAGGVLAPLLAGGTAVLAGEGRGPSIDLAVGGPAGSDTETTEVAPGAVPLERR